MRLRLNSADSLVGTLMVGDIEGPSSAVRLHSITPPPHMLLSRQARMEGFWVGQFEDRNSHALNRLSHRVRDGALKYKEDVVVGIENSPAAFIGLLNGANLGKLVLQLK